MPSGLYFDFPDLYDLGLLLTQTASIERDVGKLDHFGGEPKAKREIVDTTKCRMYWWRTTSGGVP